MCLFISFIFLHHFCRILTFSTQNSFAHLAGKRERKNPWHNSVMNFKHQFVSRHFHKLQSDSIFSLHLSCVTGVYRAFQEQTAHYSPSSGGYVELRTPHNDHLPRFDLPFTGGISSPASRAKYWFKSYTHGLRRKA